MTPQTNEQLLASKNSWARLAMAFDNQRMKLHGVNNLAIKILEQVPDLEKVHPDLPKLLGNMRAVKESAPQHLDDAMPPAFKGHGPLLDDLLQCTYYCSQISIGITETIFFDEALQAVKDQLDKPT